jgi:hypothetical protein
MFAGKFFIPAALRKMRSRVSMVRTVAFLSFRNHEKEKGGRSDRI